MNWQLKILLAFNAVMFGVAGLLEWRYYTAETAVDGIIKVSSQASASIDGEHRLALNLEELHKSFQNRLQNITLNTTLSNGLIAQAAIQQATRERIPGDGSSFQLANAAVLLICFNRYSRQRGLSMPFQTAIWSFQLQQRHYPLHTQQTRPLTAICNSLQHLLPFEK